MSLPSATGAYVTVAATGASLTVLGQSLSGDLTVTVTTGTAPSVAISLANGALSLGGGLVSAGALTGHLTLSTTDAFGTLNGALAINVPGLSLSAGTVSVTADTATASCDECRSKGCAARIAACAWIYAG